MRDNVIKLYNLEPVNTTIVLRGLHLNEDVQTIKLWPLESVITTIVLHPLPPISVPPIVATFFGILRRWTGTIWERALLKAFVGSFTPKPLMLWDGVEWQEIDAEG